jgi:hypothetical protein
LTGISVVVRLKVEYDACKFSWWLWRNGISVVNINIKVFGFAWTSSPWRCQFTKALWQTAHISRSSKREKLEFWNEALPHGSHLQNITNDKFLVAALSTIRIVLSLVFILLGFSACLYHAMSTILVNKVVPITKDCALPYEAYEARR